MDNSAVVFVLLIQIISGIIALFALVRYFQLCKDVTEIRKNLDKFMNLNYPQKDEPEDEPEQ